MKLARKHTNGNDKHPSRLDVLPKAVLAQASAAPSPAQRLTTEREQVGLLMKTVKAVRQGDFSARMKLGLGGPLDDVGEILNEIFELYESMTAELVRVGKIVGEEGRMTERVSMGSINRGSWATSVNCINELIGNLVQPTSDAARVITAVAQGDLSQKMAMEIEGRALKGEFARIGITVNTMVDQLNSFASDGTGILKRSQKRPCGRYQSPEQWFPDSTLVS